MGPHRSGRDIAKVLAVISFICAALAASLKPAFAEVSESYKCNLGPRLDIEQLSSRPDTDNLLPIEKMARGIREEAQSNRIAQEIIAAKEKLISDSAALIREGAVKLGYGFVPDSDRELALANIERFKKTFCIAAFAESIATDKPSSSKKFIELDKTTVDNLNRIARHFLYRDIPELTDIDGATLPKLDASDFKSPSIYNLAIDLAGNLSLRNDRVLAQITTYSNLLRVAIWSNSEENAQKYTSEIIDRIRLLDDADAETPQLEELGHMIQGTYGKDARIKLAKRQETVKDFKILPREVFYRRFFAYLVEVLGQRGYEQAKELAWVVQNLAPQGPKQYPAAPSDLFTALRAALAQPPASFGAATEPSAACANAAGNAGALRTLLVGVHPNPEGPINDLELIQGSLRARGVAALLTRVASDATRQSLLKTLENLVSETRCGDLVFVHFSGGAFSAADTDGTVQGLPDGWAAFIGLGVAEFGKDAYFERQLLRGIDLSEFVTAIRNRGASIVMFLDTSGAAGLGIQHFQDLAEFNDRWRSQRAPSGAKRRHELDALTPVMRNAGDYAIFYAADKELEALEYPLPDPAGGVRKFGLFSYSLAKALQTIEHPTVDALASAILAEFQTQRDDAISSKVQFVDGVSGEFGFPIVEGSNRTMDVLSPGRALPAEALDLEIISPARVHGTNKLELSGSRLTLIGRIPSPRRALKLSINGKDVDFDTHGQFDTGEMTLKPGQDVQVTALYNDLRWRTTTIPVNYDGDLERLMAQGQRYALVIGIQDYVHWPKLETPRNDARAVAEILRKEYGFKTEIADKDTGATIPLLLLDPNLADIHNALEILRKSLGDYDSLLIYYAGHGHYLGQSKDAYWIPRDGKPDDDFSWLAANALRSKLKQMYARGVLVVSDSCFSGAMRGPGPGDLSIFDPEKRRALKKAGERPSRIFMSSGALTPVLDEGGACGVHSIFACAFLKGLRNMKAPIFSSGQLYADYVYPGVQGREDQAPQWDKLAGSAADENSGEFIFARNQALEEGKTLEAATPSK